jgi:hypothetical protein
MGANMKRYIILIAAMLVLWQSASAYDFTIFTRQSITNGRWYLELLMKRNNQNNSARFKGCGVYLEFESISGLDFYNGVTDESSGWSDLQYPPYVSMTITTNFTQSPLTIGWVFNYYPLLPPTKWADCVPWPSNNEVKIARLSMLVGYTWRNSAVSWYSLNGNIRASILESDDNAISEPINDVPGTYFYFQPPNSNFGLPVELSSFNGNLINNQVKLSWKTATESNSLGYDIERSALNTNWENIGFVPSHGTTTTEQDYTFVDKNLPVASELCYRLKMTDMDGSYEYSQVLKIPIGVLPRSPELQAVYPNPTTGDAVVHFSLPRDAIVSIALYDILGKEVRRLYGNEALDAGEYMQAMDVAGLANGKYFVRMSAGDYHKTESFVLQR